MTAHFTLLDWGIVASYILLLALAGILATRRQRDAADYFWQGTGCALAGGVGAFKRTQLLDWGIVAFPAGAPDPGDAKQRGDYTYLTKRYLGPLLAARLLVAEVHSSALLCRAGDDRL